MNRGMEKKQKGLFGRLLDFWREKIGGNEMEGIGFWNDRGDMENHFAEMGAVAALSQQETKKAFWEKTAVKKEKTTSAEELLEKQKRFLYTETAEEEKKEAVPFAETEMTEKKHRAKPFSVEIFQENKQTEEKERAMGTAFFAEIKEEKREKRSIVPVFAEAEQEEEVYEGEEKKIPVREIHKREKTQEESAIDIEKLMRQMTKKLWEERESCGRRLR